MTYFCIQFLKESKSIIIECDESIAPIGINSIVNNIKNGTYDNINVERLEPNFVLQPLFFDGKDENLDKLIEPEFKHDAQKSFKFEKGSVGLAGDENNSSSSQFFICLTDSSNLNGKFTYIGKVIKGFDLLDYFNKVSVNEGIIDNYKFHYPKENIMIAKVSLISDYKEMITKVANNEESFMHLFSTSAYFNKNLSKWTSRFLKDKWDDNCFEAFEQITEDDLKMMENYQLSNNDDFLEIISSFRLKRKFDLEEEILFTMVFNGDSNKIKTNKNLSFKKPLLEDIIKLETKHYGENYGKEFCKNNVTMLYNNIDYIGAYLDDILVGACYLYKNGCAICLDALLVDDNYRNIYIASSLIKYVIENNKDSYVYLHADADDTVKEMYSKMGFITIYVGYSYFKKIVI